MKHRRFKPGQAYTPPANPGRAARKAARRDAAASRAAFEHAEEWNRVQKERAEAESLERERFESMQAAFAAFQAETERQLRLAALEPQLDLWFRNVRYSRP